MSADQFDQAVVVTDLDGSLLDHDNYDFGPALPALQRLSALNIPVIPATSKTAAETQVWMKRLSLRDAAIVENGSAVLVPSASRWRTSIPADRIELGVSAERIRPRLARWKQQAHAAFVAFSEMDVETVERLTGLSRPEAERAMAREYSETLHWQGDTQALQAFAACAEAEGLRCVRGGRFVHVMGAVDKADAARELLQRTCPPNTALIALGDAPNDSAMIQSAHFGVWVRSQHHESPQVRAGMETYRTRSTGPAGWQEGIAEALDWLNGRITTGEFA